MKKNKGKGLNRCRTVRNLSYDQFKTVGLSGVQSLLREPLSARCQGFIKFYHPRGGGSYLARLSHIRNTNTKLTVFIYG